MVAMRVLSHQTGLNPVNISALPHSTASVFFAHSWLSTSTLHVSSPLPTDSSSQKVVRYGLWFLYR